MIMSTSNVPAFVLKKAKQRSSYLQKELEQARKRIDERYQDFLILLPQNEKLLEKGGYTVSGEAELLGIFSYEKGTYMSIEKPYVTVDGRVQMARDEHKEKEAKLNIHAPIIQQFGEIYIVSVTVESELYGTATGTIEVGSKNSVDKNNPFANAQTSAIGRALGFLGYGLIGTGVIASAEEAEQALDEDTSSYPPKGTQPVNDSKKPLPFRVQILDLPQFNLDGSSLIKVLLESKQEASVVFPKEQKQFASNLKVTDVVHINGWINEDKMRLNVAKNSTSTIEKAS